MATREIGGRIIVDPKDTEAKGKTIRSLVASEQHRVVAEMRASRYEVLQRMAREKGRVPPDPSEVVVDWGEAYRVACENVGDICEPKLTAEQVKDIDTGYMVAARMKAAQEKKKEEDDMQRKNGWFELDSFPGYTQKRTRRDELDEMLSPMKPGDIRGKNVEDADEAKRWQTAIGSWARSRGDGWYDKQGSPLYRTTVRERREGTADIIVQRLG